MSNGPEPLDRNLEDQMKAFRAKLDGSQSVPPYVTIPGFLFRDGKDHHYSALSYDPHYLVQLRETHRMGLEAGAQLLDKIKVDEILQMVRSSWGGGIITRNGLCASLTYSYWAAQEEVVVSSSTREIGWSVGGGASFKTSSSIDPTGRWYAIPLQIQELIKVCFGSSDYHHPGQLYNLQFEQFFSDRIFAREGVVRDGVVLSAHNRPEPGFFGLPRTIWSRPDNLGGFCVTSPYAMLPESSSWRKLVNTDSGSHIASRRDMHLDKDYISNFWCASDDIRGVWFNRSVVARDMIQSYLAQKLSEQERNGHLPSQQEALERAKLEELHKRGKLHVTRDATTFQLIYDPYNPTSPPDRRPELGYYLSRYKV